MSSQEHYYDVDINGQRGNCKEVVYSDGSGYRETRINGKIIYEEFGTDGRIRKRTERAAY